VFLEHKRGFRHGFDTDAGHLYLDTRSPLARRIAR